MTTATEVEVDSPPSEESDRTAAPTPSPAGEAARQPEWLPRRLAVVLAGGLLLRLLVVLWLIGEPLHVMDEQEYDAIATSLATSGRYATDGGQLTSIRPPLYPAFLAAVYAISGEQAFTLVRLLQAILGTLTAYAVFVLARRLYDDRVGVVAAGICAFYPSLVATTGLLLTETLFILMLVIACLLMERYLGNASLWAIAGCGGVLALAALTRSVLWLFPAPLLLFLLVCGPHSLWRRRLLHVSVALVVFAAILAPWAIRNTLLHGTFTTVDVMGGRNFMMGNYEHTPFDRPWDAVSVEGDDAWHVVVRQRYPEESRHATQGQLDKLAMKYAIHYVLEHPGQTLQRDLAKFFHFWQLEREIIAGLSRGYWGAPPKPVALAIAAAILGSYVAVMIAGIYGLALRPPQNWRTHVFLLLVIAFVCGMHTLVFGHSRYHLPLMPLLFVYAAAAWTARSELFLQWRRPAFWGASLVCLVLAVGWGREILLEMGRL